MLVLGTLDVWYTGGTLQPVGTLKVVYWYSRIVIGHFRYV